MNYAYIRFSTDHQDEVQQVYAIEQYASSKGLTIDVVEKDEGVSGGVSYKDRKLAGLVKRMSRGDVLIVTEISRLGRSMADLNTLVNEELKKRGVRLIVIKMGIDLDCSELKAVDQMLLYAFSFAAQLEKEMIVQRTQSAIDARKERIRIDGGFVSKSGNFCDHLGRKKGDKNPNAGLAMCAKKIENAAEWKRRSPLYMMATRLVLKGVPRSEILRMTDELYEKDPVAYGTREGCRLSKGVLSRWANDVLIKN
jgi:DNA invertase Pin-like site-specific DNA recombinase